MADEAVERMNAMIAKQPSSRFCALRAKETGERLKFKKIQLVGSTEPQPVLVRVDKDGKVLTNLDNAKTPPTIGVRTPMLKVTRAFAQLARLTTNNLDRASQMIEAGAIGECLLSKEALNLLDVRAAFAQFVHKHGTCMPNDPRKKQIAKERKKPIEEFEQYIRDLLEGPGAPYATYAANRGELSKDKEVADEPMVFRHKPFQRLYPPNDEDRTSEWDKLIPRVDELLDLQSYPCKISPITLYYENKVVKPENYDDIVSRISLAYFTLDMKLLYNDKNKTHTIMVQPKECVIAALGPPRGKSEEAPVDFSLAMKKPTDASNEEEHPVDVADVLENAAKKQKLSA